MPLSKVKSWPAITWTDDHYRLALRIVGRLNVPYDKQMDIIQELLAHPGRLASRRDGAYVAFLRELLKKVVLDEYRKASGKRVKEDWRPKGFVGLDEAVLIPKVDVQEHSPDWQALFKRNRRREKGLTEIELTYAARHCCECQACFRSVVYPEPVFNVSNQDFFPGWDHYPDKDSIECSLLIAATLQNKGRDWKSRDPQWLLPYIFEEAADVIKRKAVLRILQTGAKLQVWGGTAT